MGGGDIPSSEGVWESPPPSLGTVRGVVKSGAGAGVRDEGLKPSSRPPPPLGVCWRDGCAGIDSWFPVDMCVSSRDQG